MRTMMRRRRMTNKTSRSRMRRIRDEEGRKTEDRKAGGSERRSRMSRTLEHPGAGGSEEEEREKQELEDRGSEVEDKVLNTFGPCRAFGDFKRPLGSGDLHNPPEARL